MQSSSLRTFSSSDRVAPLWTSAGCMVHHGKTLQTHVVVVVGGGVVGVCVCVCVCVGVVVCTSLRFPKFLWCTINYAGGLREHGGFQ